MPLPPLPPSASPAAAAPARRAGAVARDYWTLTKPEISLLVTLSSFAGFVLGTPGPLPLGRLAATLFGVCCTAMGVGALNHYLERHLDAEMKRTAGRPIPAGRITPGRARLFGAALVAVGVGTLCPLTNPLTGVLAALTVALYLFVYTPLKRKTVYNTLIGTLPGALPALGGWTAATGQLSAGGWIWFAVLALWQMPHFLSLAWMYRKDYGRARYAMLPVVDEDGTATVRQTLGFTALLAGASVLPWAIGLTGGLYLAGAVIANALFLRAAWRFYGSRSVQDARAVLMESVRYVPLLIGLILLDRWL